MADTKIEWATKVWNPVTGCTPISEGCKNCYAARIAGRFWGDRKFSDVQCHPERLNEPMKWRNLQMVFVNSMSDLFHEDVPPGFISDVFQVMEKNKQQTFMILTKRPQRMKRLIEGVVTGWQTEHRKNIWLGVTAENQKEADERIPILLQIPAAVRFVSVEPMLGRVDLEPYLQYPPFHENYKMSFGTDEWKGLDWIIAGPETGPRARIMEPEWIAYLYYQCAEAEVPFFDKKDTLGLGLKQFPKEVSPCTTSTQKPQG